MNIRDRIKAARLQAGLSLDDAAAQLDVTRQAWILWEKTEGVGPKRERVPKIARVLGVSPQWLLTGNDANVPLRGTYIYVRRWTSKKHKKDGQMAGHVSIANRDNDEETYAYRTDWIERKGLRAEALTIIDQPDDDMGPVQPRGATLLVDTNDERLTNGEVYAFDVDGNPMVRRVFTQLDGRFVLKPDSERAAAFSDIPRSQLEVIGRVVHVSFDR